MSSGHYVDPADLRVEKHQRFSGVPSGKVSRSAGRWDVILAEGARLTLLNRASLARAHNWSTGDYKDAWFIVVPRVSWLSSSLTPDHQTYAQQQTRYTQVLEWFEKTQLQAASFARRADAITAIKDALGRFPLTLTEPTQPR